MTLDCAIQWVMGLGLVIDHDEPRRVSWLCRWFKMDLIFYDVFANQAVIKRKCGWKRG